MDAGTALPGRGRRFPAWLGRTLRLGVLIGLLAYILHGVDFSLVGATLKKLPVWAPFAGLALIVTGQFLQALRWKALLRDPSVRLLDCLAFISLGSSLTMVSPSGLISDGTVSYWMGRRNQAVLKSMSTLLASRFIGVASMLIFLAMALPAHTWVFQQLTFGWAPAKALFLGLALVSLAVVAFLARRQKDRILALLNQALPALRSPRHLILAVLLSMGIQLTQFGIQAVGCKVLEIPVGFLSILFFTPIITFIGMIPMSIGGLGVREGLYVFFYTMLPGVGKEQILALASFGYLLLVGMAALNLLFAYAVLGKPGSQSRGEGMSG